MKLYCVMFCALSMGVIADENAKVYDMLAVAATNQGSSYLAARENILALGTNALPALAHGAVATNLSWQQRLIARICYERLVRGADIQSLKIYNWREDPGYQKAWERHIMGPEANLAKIVVPKFRDIGLWHYYIELSWKDTGEVPKAEGGLQKWWERWCFQAVTNGPEWYWCRQAVSERMLTSTFSGWHVGRYQTFLKKQDPDVVFVLIKCYDAFNRSEVNGLEMYPGENANIYRTQFLPILAFADSRHADLLEKFILDKPALTPLRERLAEVRARPAPAPKNEPSFRLGTNLVVIAP